jgi:hypothetical protein
VRTLSIIMGRKKKSPNIGTEWLQKHIEWIYSDEYAKYLKKSEGIKLHEDRKERSRKRKGESSE